MFTIDAVFMDFDQTNSVPAQRIASFDQIRCGFTALAVKGHIQHMFSIPWESHKRAFLLVNSS